MINRGDYRHLIVFYTNQESDEENEIGEKKEVPTIIGQTLAKKEFRGGGLLSGRPADTVMTKVTHKFSYPVANFSTRLIAEKHWIVCNGVRYDVEYSIPIENNESEAQVFVSEKL